MRAWQWVGIYVGWDTKCATVRRHQKRASAHVLVPQSRGGLLSIANYARPRPATYLTIEWGHTGQSRVGRGGEEEGEEEEEERRGGEEIWVEDTSCPPTPLALSLAKHVWC